MYRELFALRQRGLNVAAACVHCPEGHLSEAGLSALAREAVPVYGLGPLLFIRDALAETMRRPLQSLGTIWLGLRDACLSPHVSLSRRPKVLLQMLGGLVLARRVRPLGVRHIHAHMAHVPTTIGMYAARQLGITFSFTGHANDLFPERTLLPEKLSRAAFVACISRWHREFYRSFVKLVDDRLPIVRCGVDIPALADRHPSVHRTCRILAVGRLVAKKGLDTLIRALAGIHGDVGVSCAIIGDGPEESDLKRLVEMLCLGEGVKLLGPRRHAAVLEMMKTADLFVLPCRVDPRGDRDGIPVVLMEAMAAGVCVIAGDLPAIRELVIDGQTGRLVQPGNVKKLTATLRGLLTDSAERSSLGEAGRRWVAQEFAMETNIDRLLAAFSRVVQPSVSSHSAPTAEPMSCCQA